MSDEVKAKGKAAYTEKTAREEAEQTCIKGTFITLWENHVH